MKPFICSTITMMTTGYMLIAIQFEENDLTRRLGEKYQAYKQSAPMLIPFTKFLKEGKINDRKAITGLRMSCFLPRDRTHLRRWLSTVNNDQIITP